MTNIIHRNKEIKAAFDKVRIEKKTTVVVATIIRK